MVEAGGEVMGGLFGNEGTEVDEAEPVDEAIVPPDPFRQQL